MWVFPKSKNQHCVRPIAVYIILAASHYLILSFFRSFPVQFASASSPWSNKFFKDMASGLRLILPLWSVDHTILGCNNRNNNWKRCMTPLIIESTSYHRKHLLSSKRPLLIESTKHHGTSCHRKHLLSSRVPLIIGSTSYHRKDLFLSRVQSIMGPLVIGSTSYHREYLLSSERPLVIGRTSCYQKHLSLSKVPLVIERHFCQTGSVIEVVSACGRRQV